MNLSDQDLTEALVAKDPAHSDDITPGESRLTRAVVALLSPMWLSAIGVAALGRVFRRRRPVVVMHERTGFGRQPLWVPKIATAAVESNERRFGGLVELATGPPVELNVDGRLEHWLRRTGADELPQLFLVLAGTMRVVGPRPVTRSELEAMTTADHRVGVDFLHPGLVGLWQVLDRHAYKLPERRDLDMLMVNNWTPALQRRLLLIAARQTLGRIGPVRNSVAASLPNVHD